MRGLWRLAIANWWASPGRAVAAVLSVALGVGVVVTVTNFHETARRGITDEVVTHWLGSAHVTVHPVGAHWASLDASVLDALRDVPNLAHITGRLRRHVRLVPVRGTENLVESFWGPVDAVGVMPETEVRFRTLPGLSGRGIQAGERGVAVMEGQQAAEWHVELGELIALKSPATTTPAKFRVVGFFESRRVAEFQLPTVYVSLEDAQELVGAPNTVSEIDLMLRDTSTESIAAARAEVERRLTALAPATPYSVETAEARQLVLSEAERITRLLLMLIAFVAMLTSFFIILTTQSVSLVQRRPQLGVMRCIGMTREQLTLLVLFELVPLGAVGTLLGVAGGFGVTQLIAHVAERYVVRVYASQWGLALAVASGLTTTLLSAALLALRVGGVSPLESVHTHARPPRMRLIYMVSAAGLALLALHEWMTLGADGERWLNGGFAGLGAASLHLGWILTAPAVVVLLGPPIARRAGRLLGMRPKLVEEPFLRAPWRSTGACWVLIVGLSLIVYVAVRAEGILAIWAFPAKLPGTFVWSPRYVPSETIEQVRRLPGVGKFTISTDVPCELESVGAAPKATEDSLVERFLKSLTKPVFVAGDPDALLGMLKVAFAEGDQPTALEKLRRGGYVLIPTPTSRNRNLHLGDRVRITVAGRVAEFEVAGVVQSPALDLAVTAFQAESYMQFAAASAVLGTQDDLRERLGFDGVSMFMCEVELTPTSPPESFLIRNVPNLSEDRTVADAILRWRDGLPEERENISRIEPGLRAWLTQEDEPLPHALRDELRRFAKAMRTALYSARRTRPYGAGLWQAFRERLVLLNIARVMDRPDAIVGSLTRLKAEIDQGLRRAIVLVTWLPSVLLVVAAIGVANLMMVSVHLRSRQFAVLRAIGALKSQIVRLVLAEAITIGLLGSVIGVALGLHEAHSVNKIAAGLIDVDLEFVVPWGTVGLAVLLTVAVCLIAGIAPARYAARENIVAAMQTA